MRHDLTYRPLNGADDRRGRRILFATTVAVAILLLFDFLSGGALRSMLRTVGSAVSERARAVGTSVSQSGIFSTKASLARQNAALLAQVAQLQDKAAAYAAVDSQNQQLQALVHLSMTAPGITAPITSSFTSSPYGTFSIGAGSADAVQKGALVATSDGFVIGRVAEVSSHAALVVGIFAPGQSIDTLIHGLPVTLKGQGGGVASGEAPRAAVITVGDTVVAPSLGQRTIGIVGSVEGTVASASTKLLVRVPVNLESLSFVYVETTH